MIDTNLNDKVVLIAGATGGIGSGVAKRLGSAGAIPVLMGRSEEKLQKLQETLPGTSYRYVADFNEVQTLSGVFPFIKEQGKKLDGMVYAAGVCNNLPVKAVDLTEMQHNMNVNYYAYVELCKGFANKRYSNNNGSIIGLSSTASVMCDKAMSQYAASKAALNAATKTMAKEFVSRKIRVNALAPAFVDTRMAWQTSEIVGDFEEHLQKNMPYGIIPVEEIATWCEFLLSDVSGHMTGEIIIISGGIR